MRNEAAVAATDATMISAADSSAGGVGGDRAVEAVVGSAGVGTAVVELDGSGGGAMVLVASLLGGGSGSETVIAGDSLLLAAWSVELSERAPPTTAEVATRATTTASTTIQARE